MTAEWKVTLGDDSVWVYHGMQSWTGHGNNPVALPFRYNDRLPLSPNDLRKIADALEQFQGAEYERAN